MERTFSVSNTHDLNHYPALKIGQQAEGTKLEEDRIKKTEILMKKIQAYGKQFSEKNNIEILLMNGEGGQFNYISREEFLLLLSKYYFFDKNRIICQFDCKSIRY